MALPSSGQLSVGNIRDEQVNNAGVASSYSLRQLSANAGLSTSDSISEFYGYGLVTSGLILNLQTNGTFSYPGSGTTWSDKSGNNYTATMSGTVPYVAGSPGYFSYTGGNYKFDGNNSLASNVGTAVTVISIANITNMSTRSILFSKYKTTNPTGYILEAGTVSGLWSSTLRWYAAGNSGNSNDLRGTTTLNANQIYMFSVTYNQPTAATTMYANTTAISATQAGVGSDTGFSQGTNNYVLGSYEPYFSIYSSMRQYAVFVYNRALSSTEITANYNFLKPIYGIS
jgi:hypothetical protein